MLDDSSDATNTGWTTDEDRLLSDTIPHFFPSFEDQFRTASETQRPGNSFQLEFDSRRECLPDARWPLYDTHGTSTWRENSTSSTATWMRQSNGALLGNKVETVGAVIRGGYPHATLYDVQLPEHTLTSQGHHGNDLRNGTIRDPLPTLNPLLSSADVHYGDVTKEKSFQAGLGSIGTQMSIGNAGRWVFPENDFISPSKDPARNPVNTEFNLRNDISVHKITPTFKCDPPYPTGPCIPTIDGVHQEMIVRWLDTNIQPYEVENYCYKIPQSGVEKRGKALVAGKVRNALLWGPLAHRGQHLQAGDVWVKTSQPPTVSVSQGEGVWVEWLGNDHAEDVKHPLLPDRRLWFSFNGEFGWIKDSCLVTKRSLWRRTLQGSGEYMHRHGRVDHTGRPVQLTVEDVVSIMDIARVDRRVQVKNRTARLRFACNRCRQSKVRPHASTIEFRVRRVWGENGGGHKDEQEMDLCDGRTTPETCIIVSLAAKTKTPDEETGNYGKAYYSQVVVELSGVPLMRTSALLGVRVNGTGGLRRPRTCVGVSTTCRRSCHPLGDEFANRSPNCPYLVTHE
ncbi:hypothetical protein BV25DRAFT_1837430 [Artomyces pyxidatus]|uniref:Uncharacterized protein n=1 Tax=Artomyces pyxidatus TaxID=48021 RepID=A0ACB8T6V8_9AGAM|nr:hypothetical protein BV25DRAFT_1837430 [Artomyces pyxidatus]